VARGRTSSLATQTKFPFHVRSAKTLMVNRANLFSNTVQDLRDSNRSRMCLASASIGRRRFESSRLSGYRPVWNRRVHFIHCANRLSQSHDGKRFVVRADELVDGVCRTRISDPSRDHLLATVGNLITFSSRSASATHFATNDSTSS